MPQTYQGFDNTPTISNLKDPESLRRDFNDERNDFMAKIIQIMLQQNQLTAHKSRQI